MITPTRLPALVLALLLPAAPAVAQAPAEGPEAQLIAVLTSGATPDEKADACRQLAQVGTARSVPALAALLADERLGHMARYGLEPIPGPEADAALRNALGQAKGLQLVGVVASLGVRRDAQSVPALATLLGNPDAEVAQAAARALGSIGTAAAAAPLKAALPTAAPAIRLALCEGLLRCAEAFAAAADNPAAAAVYDTLRQLPDPPHQVRTAAWRGAILARPGAGMPLLLEALRSTDPALVTAATRIALEVKDPAATPTLAAELGKAPAPLQPALAGVLGARRDPAALPALLILAKAGEPPARVAALRAATEIGDAAAATTLAELLLDPNPDVAGAAAAGLAGLPGTQVDDLVTKGLDSPDQPLRLKMVEITRQRRITAALPALLKLIDSPDQALRSAAIGCCAELAGEAEFSALLEQLTTCTDPGQIEALEQAVAAVCGASAQPAACVPPLAQALAKAAPAAKPAVLRTLRVAGGPDALAAVRGAVSDPDANVHASAIRVLGEWKTADAIPVLLELAKSSGTEIDKILSLRGCLGIAARPDVPAPQRLAACRDAAPLITRDDEKRLLLGTLGNLADPAALDLVTPCLDQPAVKQEAVAATMAIAEKRPPKQHAEITKAALAKVIAVAPDNQQVVTRAQQLISAIEAGN